VGEDGGGEGRPKRSGFGFEQWRARAKDEVWSSVEASGGRGETRLGIFYHLGTFPS